jgi:predicted membrane channel-forming protein YqfA (hemolysin III family)
MKTILIILGVVYLVVGFIIYLLTMQESDALQNTIAGHSPVNTYGYTHKWLWLLIICLWPVWLFVSEKLSDEGKKGPF